ncbi:IS3 family transposase [Falsiporphyromonas endometrii]|uniref:IS3 family transposase n=1 Tax=Falsiporphyromonas endometrii TaxID=1387297 RepID=A0ABV9K5Z8_9PORP
MSRTVTQYKEEKSVSISGVCRLLGISRQKYYRQQWSISKSRERATEVVEMVREVRLEIPRIGTRKLYHMLHLPLRKKKVGRDRLFAILRANHLLIKPARSYHTTTNSHHRFRKHKNLIENMVVSRPEEVWVSDITYIGNRNGHMYLSLITDAYSKKIMGYDLSDSLETQGPLKALKMANRNRLYKDVPPIHHSDRGIQYCSNAYQKLLKRYRITPGMTESYDPYANAVAERVNGILKQEFLLEELHLPSQHMKQAVKDAICKYNRLRPHFSCGYNTPEYMHHQNRVKIKTYKKKQIIKAGLDNLFEK